MAKTKNNKLQGPLAFEAWYGLQEGERWPSLRAACALENKHYCLEKGLLAPYYLDEASVLAALWLEPEPNTTILDLCSAPGGKTLTLMSRAIQTNCATSIRVLANERSQARRERLKKVIKNHLAEEYANRVEIWGHDAARWGQYRPESVDRVLLDAPCSSERHLIHQPNYLEDWSPSRSKHLSQQAYTMFLSACQALKPNGLLVYATCAISNLENDLVVQRALERLIKKPEKPELHYEISLPQKSTSPELCPDWCEATEYGVRILPDRSEGRGPLYLTRIKKFSD